MENQLSAWSDSCPLADLLIFSLSIRSHQFDEKKPLKWGRVDKAAVLLHTWLKD
jgi:hypothetical protein